MSYADADAQHGPFIEIQFIREWHRPGSSDKGNQASQARRPQKQDFDFFKEYAASGDKQLLGFALK